MSRNVPASIRAQLLNRAKANGEDFQLVLVRYVCERFLYRLGQSAASDQCVLKGGSLIAVWLEEPYRATRDIDMLATGGADEFAVRGLVEAVCDVPCPEDGLAFDTSCLRVTPIREAQAYPGHQARLDVHLDNARIPLQVDFGFGDAVPKESGLAQLRTLLPGLPAPSLRVYPRTATVAEKFEAMVQLGRRNTRMKDFHDIWALSEAFDFGGVELQQALRECFARRRTAWTSEPPAVLTAAFYATAEAQDRWAGYCAKEPIIPPPASFATIGERVQMFLGPVRESIVGNERFAWCWMVAGPWRRT